MLALEGGEVAAAEQRSRAAPDRFARNDEAAEIFEEAAKLRIAGGVGNLAMESEILIDRGFAAIDRFVDRRAKLADLPDLRDRGTLGGQADRLDLDPGAQFHHIEHVAERRALVEFDAERPANIVGDKSADALAGHHQPVGA